MMKRIYLVVEKRGEDRTAVGPIASPEFAERSRKDLLLAGWAVELVEAESKKDALQDRNGRC